MSLRSVLASPPLVASAGVAVSAVLAVGDFHGLAASLAALKVANVAGLLINMGAVSAPGRIDERQDLALRRGQFVTKPEEQPLMDNAAPEVNPLDPHYSTARRRTLVSPSGWAFSIWGLIYVGETALVVGQYVVDPASVLLTTVLPKITVPLCAAHAFQSLWCASFRPRFENEVWTSYIAPCMLAGTAYSLSQVHAVTSTLIVGTTAWWLAAVPLTLHYGWTTAATLVNLSGSVAANSTTSDRTVIAVGHASAVVATAVGVGVTLAQSEPIYGITLAWALAGCADNMRRRRQTTPHQDPTLMARAEMVQQQLCTAGVLACAVAAAVVALVG